MSSARALSDDQVAGELQKMESFIRKEAEEKSREIRLKADEEYEIEKASIVRSEINAIDSLYEAKFKKATLAQQITKSTIANKTRLKILATKEQSLEEILEDAEAELKKISKDKSSYTKVLSGLIEEGLFALMEEKVSVKGRKQDLELLKEAAKTAKTHFEETAKFEVEINIIESDFLNESSAGGVIIINGTGKIEVNNTLGERLQLLSETALPAVRLELFGPSETRKFFD
ncbi:hypothetical protein B5S31_g2150 [[Candida] boidinii]|nr:hypothetical protein B5S29_g1837 [[Candida] boidinii]OWB72440.1 hypothetical protein B5S31_g2150 [[Candida] boidinii]GMF01717.1 unnamed protein product [[Candida] boidinii]